MCKIKDGIFMWLNKNLVSLNYFEIIYYNSITNYKIYWKEFYYLIQWKCSTLDEHKTRQNNTNGGRNFLMKRTEERSLKEQREVL